MTNGERTLKERAHGVDATLRVGKPGIESVADKLADRLGEQGGTKLIETYGNTATCH